MNNIIHSIGITVAVNLFVFKENGIDEKIKKKIYNCFILKKYLLFNHIFQTEQIITQYSLNISFNLKKVKLIEIR